jgi:hypothetical protein
MVFVILVQMNMEKHLGSQDVARFPAADPSWESPAIGPEPFYVLSHVDKEGRTMEVDIVYFNITPHLNTFIRGTCKFWGDSDYPKLGIK